MSIFGESVVSKKIVFCLSLSMVAASCGATQKAQRELKPEVADEVEEGTYDPSCSGSDIREKLDCIKGLEVLSVVVDPKRNATVYELRFPQRVRQRVVGDNQWFKQRIVLSHRGQNEPMVLQTSGYSVFGVRDSELSREFQTNQIQVEHRFFADSAPSEIEANLDALTVHDSATDFHRITVAFKNIYSSKWINTGASKGGMTSMYHRRFFPNDVDATVSYVAPISTSIWDPRYVDFVDRVGGDEFTSCRQSLMDLQRSLLSNRDKVLPLLPGSFEISGSKEVSFEAAVIEMPFGFFQYQDARTACPNVPTQDASVERMVEFLEAVYSVNDNFGDEALKVFWPYYFQSANELGYPGARLDHLSDLLKTAEKYQVETYTVHKPVPAFRAETMRDIRNWVSTESTRIMHIYGEFDPWSAAQFEVRSASESLLLVDAEGTHGAKISTLSPDDQALAWSTLESWFGKSRVQVVETALHGIHAIQSESQTPKDIEDIERANGKRRL